MIPWIGLLLSLSGSPDSTRTGIPMRFQLGGGFSLEQTPIAAAWFENQGQFDIGPCLLRYTLGLPLMWQGGGDNTMAEGQQQPDVSGWRQSLSLGFETSDRFHIGLGAGMAWTNLDTFVVTPSKKPIVYSQSDGSIGSTQQCTFCNQSYLEEDAWLQTTTVESFDPFGYVEFGFRLHRVDMNVRLTASAMGAGIGTSARYVFPTF